MIIRELKLIIVAILCLAIPAFISDVTPEWLHGVLFFWGGSTYQYYITYGYKK